MKRFFICIAITWCYTIGFAANNPAEQGQVSEFIFTVQELGILDGNASDVTYRTELDTVSYESIPSWIVKIPVRIQRFHAVVVLLKKNLIELPITGYSSFDQIGLSFSDVNTQSDFQELLTFFESSFGPSQQSDKFPGVLNYKWNLEDVALTLNWTERTNAYLLVIPK